MIDFFPIELYYKIYINLALFITLFTFFHTLILDIDHPKNIRYLNFMGYFLLFFIVIYMGLRPIHGIFTDMMTYARHFERYANGYPILLNQDLGFHIFMKFCAQFMTANTFFLVCAFMYIYPMFLISKKFFKEYWFFCFFMFVVSFSFWPYGVNGIRNGIATSFFLLAFTYSDKKILMVTYMVIACLFHKTLLLPTLAYIATLFHNNPKTYLKTWLLTIPLSLFLGSVWIAFFSSLGFADDRLGGYLTGEADAKFESLSFRWDFLIYSASAVFSGWFFIFKKGFKDIYYNRLFNIYLIANSFWILVIRANFSNRFAYISWFMMGIIIIYPLLKQQFFKNQNFVIGKILFVYFSFTYFMYFVYYADKH
ncbi:EpsG family protein [Flaviramulus sp. BrNp1-15]|uniref:EpsG family protein n=1 Tax=Flaviramulus sp. BrNp1-15 TaxID=2916754 RepID=UPI001EE9702D|nr:EpsG family protein [Flaviramulus sp. BrNp1-15]ULC58276.1 EpsG family protein [Flaviramulus sp. BrNp1-15]